MEPATPATVEVEDWRTIARRAAIEALIGPPRRFRAVRTAVGLAALIAFFLVVPRLDQPPAWPGILAWSMAWLLLWSFRPALDLRRRGFPIGAQVLNAMVTFVVNVAQFGAVIAFSATFGPTDEHSPLMALARSIDFPAVPFLVAVFVILLWRLRVDWTKAGKLKAERRAAHS